MKKTGLVPLAILVLALGACSSGPSRQQADAALCKAELGNGSLAGSQASADLSAATPRLAAMVRETMEDMAEAQAAPGGAAWTYITAGQDVIYGQIEPFCQSHGYSS